MAFRERYASGQRMSRYGCTAPQEAFHTENTEGHTENHGNRK